MPRPPQFGITDSEELMIPTPDNESLSAFLIRPANKSQARNVTVLMFHGNAGNIGYRLPIARVLEEHSGCTVLMLQYRGYGLSTGSPNEKGLNIDAQTGLDYIRQRAELKDTRIVVYGQSLGGAVGINLVAKNQDQGDIASLILENTFLSIRKLIPRFVLAVTLLRDQDRLTTKPAPFLRPNTSLLSAISTGPARKCYPRSPRCLYSF